MCVCIYVRMRVRMCMRMCMRARVRLHACVSTYIFFLCNRLCSAQHTYPNNFLLSPASVPRNVLSLSHILRPSPSSRILQSHPLCRPMQHARPNLCPTSGTGLRSLELSAIPAHPNPRDSILLFPKP